MELFAELSQATELLKDVKKCSKTLFMANAAPNKIQSLESKRLQSSSAWARSTAVRTAKSADGSSSQSANIFDGSQQVLKRADCADTFVRHRAPVYSLGKAPRYPDNKEVVDAVYGTGNLDLLSDHSRAKSVGFGPRTLTTQVSKKNLAVESTPTPPEDLCSDNGKIPTSNPSRVKGYSFGKSERSLSVNERSPSPSADSPLLLSNVDAAEKYLWSKSGGPIMKPSCYPSKALELSEQNRQNARLSKGNNIDNQSIISTEPVVKSDMSIERLSKHFTAPSATFSTAGTASPTAAQRLVRALDDHSSLGPGSYNVSNDSIAARLARNKYSGKLYRSSSPSLAANANSDASLKTREVQCQEFMALARGLSASPGPGAYSTEEAEEALRVRQPTATFGRPPVGESKGLTPQLARKRYREEKLREVSQVHDGGTDSSDRALRPRAAAVRIAPPPKGTEDGEEEQDKETRARKILRERKYLLELEAELAQQSSISASVNTRIAVEPKAKVMVAMDAESKAKEATQKFLAANPRVLKVKADAAEAEHNRDVFYGPQLQVPWVPPPLPKHLNANIQGIDNSGSGGKKVEVSDPGSPTAEVMRLLKQRQSIDRIDPQYVRAKTVLESSTAQAYLNSSWGGNPLRKPAAVVMRPDQASSHISSAREDNSNSDFDYLGPQLPLDWLAEANARSNAHKNRALRMDLSHGRDETRVRRKGFVEVAGFADLSGIDADDLGPGAYAGDNLLVFGDDARGVVAFDRVISRREAAGPFGEKAEIHAEKLADFMDDDALYAEEVLDLDYGVAKDVSQAKNVAGKNAMKLYIAERYPTEPEPANERDRAALEAARSHVGGKWFKGIAESAAVANHLDFDRMLGRPPTKAEADALAEEVLAELDLPTREELKVEVTDWQPRMPKAPTFSIADPELYPRFPTSVLVDDRDSLDVDRGYYHISGRKEAPYVDMSKMPDRKLIGTGDGGADHGDAERDVHGDIDVTAARKLESERAEAAARAAELRLKRVPFLAHMDKQSGRDGGAKSDAGAEDEGPLAYGEDPPPAAYLDSRDMAHARVKGVLPWDKATGRSQIAGGTQGVDDLDLPPAEEVILDTTKDGALSRYSRVPGATHWGANKADRFSYDKPSLTSQLDYGDVDSGKLKGKGLGPMGGGSGPSMANQRGRGDGDGGAKALEALRRDYGGGTEELIIEPSDAALRKKVPGGVSMGPGPPKIEAKVPRKPKAVPSVKGNAESDDPSSPNRISRDAASPKPAKSTSPSQSPVPVPVPVQVPVKAPAVVAPVEVEPRIDIIRKKDRPSNRRSAAETSGGPSPALSPPKVHVPSVAGIDPSRMRSSSGKQFPDIDGFNEMTASQMFDAMKL